MIIVYFQWILSVLQLYTFTSSFIVFMHLFAFFFLISLNNIFSTCFLYFKYNMCSEIHIKQANRSIHYYQVATFVAPPCKRILSDLAFKKLPWPLQQLLLFLILWNHFFSWQFHKLRCTLKLEFNFLCL